MIENAIQNLDIEINGSGDEKLDFTYIEDLLQGIYKACVVKTLYIKYLTSLLVTHVN